MAKWDLSKMSQGIAAPKPKKLDVTTEELDAIEHIVGAYIVDVWANTNSTGHCVEAKAAVDTIAKIRRYLE